MSSLNEDNYKLTRENVANPPPPADEKWFKLAIATLAISSLTVIGTIVCRHFR